MDFEQEPLRIACVGASVTFGRGLPNRRTNCYPAVLQRRLDALGYRASVRNFGYSGATASRTGNEPYWRTPSFTAASRFRPQITLIMLGTNDAQFANAAARGALGADLADLVRHFRQVTEPPGEVLLAQPPPVFPPVAEIDFTALVEEVRPAITAAAEQTRTQLVDFVTPLADRSEAFPDGLHPTAAVAEQMAEVALAAIRPLIEARRSGEDATLS
ncbi:GDSL-type esterase/lipase family protein [Botrimarina hoheduenensis]|uniref:Acetylxylan esterase n=1 Tax=Botrimarina hoheduenensis TaxID=2528000 RepID=A0A5C5VX39_9BACT|nr:GDSL-type esterase/lipase family protein [Botrimarina hoheduenensis]TWT43226.1 Acetylxylan esterase precursor [Botrimarina hoheduenensis]